MEKTVIAINMMSTGSTGKIMKGINRKAEEHGWTAYACYPQMRETSSEAHDIILCSNFFRGLNARLDRYTGLQNCFSVFSTLRLLRRIKKLHPDILHLHNLHNGFINLPLLFRFIKKHHIQTVWTLHDCWSFTGRCPHFLLSHCEKWKTGCGKCPYPKNAYPFVKTDRTKWMWKLKKKWFTGVEDLTIVTPSQWLADLVRQSYLGAYPVRVIYNGIRMDVLHPTQSEFRKAHALQDKCVLLGVARSWDNRKGLDVFLELDSRLGTEYQIVLVGTDAEIDRILPETIVSIHHTSSQEELAAIYSSADIFINPTREDTFPTVNIEALACGTPIITFRTGGSPEAITPSCGTVVNVDDIDAMEQEIRRVWTQKPYSREACTQRAAFFDEKEKYEEYIQLYEKGLKNESRGCPARKEGTVL